jgi:hypothetical protein
MQLTVLNKVTEGEDAYQAYFVSSLPCPDCKQTLVVALRSDHLYKYNQGAHITEVFPGMSDDDRERFITGYCGPCWDVLFPEEEEDE